MKKSLIKMSASIVGLLLLTVSVAAADTKGGIVTGTIELTKGAKNQNSIVYLKGIPGQFPPVQEGVVLNQKSKTFLPHVIVAQKGQKILFGNADPFSHNVHLYWGRRSMVNQAQGPGGTSEWIPKRTGEYTVLCDIHPEMDATLLVLDHPFFTTVNHEAGGEFQIENIPPGNYTLVVARDIRGKLKKTEQKIIIEPGKTTTVNVAM